MAIARAMIKTPKVFLFDEPLSNLDAKLRNHMRVEIARLHQSLKTTTVYVTHDQLEAMTLADRIVLLKDGVIEQIGSPAEIYRRPGNQFVAGFIGTPNMNFIEATVGRKGDGWTLTGAGTVLSLEGDDFHLQHGDRVVLGIRASGYEDGKRRRRQHPARHRRSHRIPRQRRAGDVRLRRQGDLRAGAGPRMPGVARACVLQLRGREHPSVRRRDRRSLRKQ
ncbi:ABC transporter ATP-binding protein [Mesorhizobium atlanticum]